MLQILLSILGILITILFVIGTHEAGHFLATRLLNVKVLRFSIGFGKPFYRIRDKKGTEYVFAPIPLGGYIKMLDENEGEVPKKDLPYAFNRQPFYKKFLIVFAGPFTNILCAFVIYWIIFMIGFVSVKPVTGSITPDSIAANAGVRSNQEIVSVDNRKTATWMGIIFRILAHTGNQDELTIQTKSLKSEQIKSHTLNLRDWKMDELTPDPLSSLGIAPYEPDIPLVIGVVATDSPAEQAKLKIGDKIVAVNDNKIENWRDLLTIINNNPDKVMLFTVTRSNKNLTIPVKIGFKRSLTFQKYGYLGLAPDFKWPEGFQQKIKYGPVGAAEHAWQQISDFTYFNLLLFTKMITGKVSLQSLGGPITIFESAGTALNYGLLSFLAFLAFLSISIGIINILPIPGLDGGHLVFQIIEFIIRKPIPQQIMIVLYQIGLLFILFILIQAFVNDVLRLY